MAKKKAAREPSDKPMPVPAPRKVPVYRQCPLCYQGYGGVGQHNGTYQKSSTLRRRYYKCDACGHTWQAVVKPAAIVREQHDVVSQSTGASDGEPAE